LSDFHCFDGLTYRSLYSKWEPPLHSTRYSTGWLLTASTVSTAPERALDPGLTQPTVSLWRPPALQVHSLLLNVHPRIQSLVGRMVDVTRHTAGQQWAMVQQCQQGQQIQSRPF
jgi:hypothetical protein